jgi:flagellar hook-associated protein 2
MAISGVSGSGIMSGLDVNGLVSQIIDLEQRPITLLSLRQNDYELKINAVLSLSAKLSSYKTAIEKLNTSETFNTKSASVTKTSGGSELLTATASSSAANGGHTIKVSQLAAANKKASNGFVDKTSTAIASSTGNFKFKVGSSGAETNIVVNSTTTLQELTDEINSSSASVTASIMNDGTGSNPYRLVLTADDSGTSNTIYIEENDTDLDFSLKQVEAAYANTDNTYAGTAASNDGNNYTGTDNKTFMIEVVTSDTPGSGNAEYKYSIDGGINWLGDGGAAYDGTNGIAVAADDTLQNIDGLVDGSTTTEGAKIKFTSGTLAVGDKFNIDVFNPEMQEAKDAVITVDNATIVKSSNEITDAIEGVTLNLLDADSSETLNLSVTSSSLTARADIESFVASYNELYEFIEEQMSYDPEEGTANPLLGDPTLAEIKRKISDSITSTIPGISSSATYKSLSQIGITTDYKTGQLSIDSSKLTIALSSNPDAVSKLFIGSATPTNQSISYESKTSTTQAGDYSISISTAPEQAVLTGDNDLSSSGLGSDEILIFKYSTDYGETDYSTTAFSVTLSAGSTINSIVTTLNSGFATNDAGFVASKTSDGKLKITTTEYGEDYWFQVTTDAEGAGHIWNDEDDPADATIGIRSDVGVDIAGSINGHVATGKGNILTGSSGYQEDGLKISTTSSQTGLFGKISVSKGISDLLPTILESYVDRDTGVLKSKESSMKDSIDDIESRILRMEAKLTTKEEQLHAQFARLEVLLSKYDAMSQFLSSAVTAMQNAKYFS